MAIAKIAAGSEKRIPTTSKYLKVSKVSGELLAYNEEAGIREFYLEQNSIVENEGVKALSLINRTAEEVEIEYYLMDMKVTSGDTGTVEIKGPVTVDSITNGVSVNASIGSVEILPANTFIEFEDLTLTTAATRLVLSADSTRKEAEIFLHGDEYSEVRIGSNAISATKGRILKGGGGVVGSMTISGTDAIYVKKVSGNDPKIAIGVEKRV